MIRPMQLLLTLLAVTLTQAAPIPVAAASAGASHICTTRDGNPACTYVAEREGIYLIEGEIPSTLARPGITLTIGGHECVTTPAGPTGTGMVRLSCYAALMGGRAYELSGKGVQGSPVAFKVVSSTPRGGETVVNIP